VRGFPRTAGDGDRVRGNTFESRSGGAEAIVEIERQSFIDADATGPEVSFGKRRGDELGGAFLLLPNANVDGVTHRFAQAAFFEARRYEERLACARDDEGEKTLAETPANAGEIVEGGAGAEKNGVEIRVESGHDFLSVNEPSVKFLRRDGVNALAERLESGERGRQWGLVLCGCGESYGGNRC